MTKQAIRVWTELDIEEVSKHLVVVGEVTADCYNCKELGIDYIALKSCPKCNAQFKYIASRSHETRKIKNRRPDLIFIDFDDFKKATGFIKAKSLFTT